MKKSFVFDVQQYVKNPILYGMVISLIGPSITMFNRQYNQMYQTNFRISDLQSSSLDKFIVDPDGRDGHDTDTKYQYCGYLRVGSKYRYCHPLILNLFWKYV